MISFTLYVPVIYFVWNKKRKYARPTVFFQRRVTPRLVTPIQYIGGGGGGLIERSRLDWRSWSPPLQGTDWVEKWCKCIEERERCHIGRFHIVPCMRLGCRTVMQAQLVRAQWSETWHWHPHNGCAIKKIYLDTNCFIWTEIG